MFKKVATMVIHLITASLLIVMAYLQLNDPDPIMWVIFYIGAAGPAVLRLWGHTNLWLNGLILAFGLVLLGYTLEGFGNYLEHMETESLTRDMSPEKPYIEEAREFLGTLFAVVIVAIYQLLAIKK